MAIPGLKLIYHNAGGVNNQDDPSLPFKLEGIFDSPEFMKFTFSLMHGDTEKIVVRAETKEMLDEFIERQGFLTHPRLISITISGPDGFKEEIKGQMA